MNNNLVRKGSKTPCGFKTYYYINFNGILTNEFLRETSLRDACDFEIFNSNISKRENKKRDIANLLKSEGVECTTIHVGVFGEPIHQLVCEEYRINSIFTKFLPHLLSHQIDYCKTALIIARKEDEKI